MSIIIHSSFQYGRSSLMWASEKGHEEVVKILLSAGAQVDLQDNVSSISCTIGWEGGQGEEG